MTELVIFDLETTGIGANHRIVEIAGVIWDPISDSVVAAFETLVNPERNMPAEVTAIHGLRAEDVSAAPVFGELAPWLERIFVGRVAVAHNASFDVPFINREFNRVGSTFEIRDFACTKVATGKSLSASTTEFGIELVDAHSAAGDAQATFELARALGSEKLMGQVAKTSTVTPLMPPSPPRTLSRFQIGLSDDSPSDASDTLAGISDETPGAVRYLAYLNETFKDLVITGDEFERLAQFAGDAGLRADETLDLNRQFLGQMESAALRDQIVTENEMAIISAFADQVGLEPSISATENRVEIAEGALICVTGNAIIDGRVVAKSEVFACIQSAGFVSTDSLGKRQGVGVLLVESYGSQSTKAKNAVQWGIPILSIEDFFLIYRTS
jgi:DNA polymerase-3 subunit epsilon